ncbi:MAG: hypothetical protein KF795_02020, partial [Labilithrix sp.]|nr:hypothetical protein [Labilithrix sp.]
AAPPSAAAAPSAATPAAAPPSAAAAPTTTPEARATNESAAASAEVVVPGVALNDVAVVAKVKVSSDRLNATPEVQATDGRSPPPTTREAPRSLAPEDAPVTIDEGRRAVASRGPLSADPPLPPEIEALLRDELPPPQSVTDPAISSGARARGNRDAEPKTAREPEPRRSAEELTLDFDALERDTGGSPLFQQGDLPPPPKNLFAKEPRTGTYSAVEADAPHDAARIPPSRPGIPSGHPPPASTTRTPATQKPASEGRYAPARPAAIFGAAAKQASPSIFGDDLVSDKSLDEVILSYLAEDLDPPRRK